MHESIHMHAGFTRCEHCTSVAHSGSNESAQWHKPELSNRLNVDWLKSVASSMYKNLLLRTNATTGYLHCLMILMLMLMIMSFKTQSVTVTK